MKKNLGFGLGIIPKFFVFLGMGLGFIPNFWVFLGMGLGMKPIPKPKTQTQFFLGCECMLPSRF